MSIIHKISSEHRLVRIVAAGEINDQDVLVAIRKFLSDSSFKPGLDTFIDLRNLENFGVTTIRVRDIALLIQEDSRVVSSARIVVVVANVFTLGVVKMFQSLTARKLPLQLVTLDYNEGLGYLELDVPLEAIFN